MTVKKVSITGSSRQGEVFYGGFLCLSSANV